MKYLVIAFVCLVVIAKVASKVVPTSAKTLRSTTPEMSKSEWEKNLNLRGIQK